MRGGPHPPSPSPVAAPQAKGRSCVQRPVASAVNPAPSGSSTAGSPLSPMRYEWERGGRGSEGRPGPRYGFTGGEGGTELMVGQSSTTTAALVATDEYAQAASPGLRLTPET